MQVIEKKLLPEYFEAVLSGKKTFEIRKDEDKIRVGDVIRLKEWGYDGKYTGRVTERVVTYILRNVPEYGLMPGYCIISIKNKE